MANGKRYAAGLAIIVVGAVVAAASPAAVFDAADAQYIYEALLDTDNDPTTGGPVTVVQGIEPPHNEVGIDYIVRVGAGVSGPTLVTPGGAAPISSGSKVFNRDVLKWNDATQMFEVVDCNNTMYPLGVGPNGEGLVEFGAPLVLIGTPTGTIRGVFHASLQSMDDNDYTASFLLRPSVQTPAQSRGALALLGALLLVSAVYLLGQRRRSIRVVLVAGCLTFATIAWAANIILDGNFTDWAGIAPAVTDVGGDSSIPDLAEDILAGYVVIQQGNIFFRMDLAGQIVPI